MSGRKLQSVLAHRAVRLNGFAQFARPQSIGFELGDSHIQCDIEWLRERKLHLVSPENQLAGTGSVSMMGILDSCN